MEFFVLVVLFGITLVVLLALTLFGFAIVITFAIAASLEVPYVVMPRAFYQAITDALNIQPDDTVYELGSGNGGFLLTLASQFPGTRFVGLERNAMLYWYSCVRKRTLYGNPPNVSFRRENFLTAEFSEATKMYVYLYNSIMDQLLPRFESEVGTLRIASRAFQFKHKEASHIVELSKKPGNHGQHLLYVYDFIK